MAACPRLRLERQALADRPDSSASEAPCRTQSSGTGSLRHTSEPEARCTDVMQPCDPVTRVLGMHPRAPAHLQQLRSVQPRQPPRKRGQRLRRGRRGRVRRQQRALQPAAGHGRAGRA